MNLTATAELFKGKYPQHNFNDFFTWLEAHAKSEMINKLISSSRGCPHVFLDNSVIAWEVQGAQAR